jgi:ABC-type nitrate/sulfonate/bicarbonate transport system permease component
MREAKLSVSAAVQSTPRQHGWGRLSRLFRGRRLGVALIGALFLMWELSARSGLITSSNWPPVSTVFVTAFREIRDGDLLASLAGTLYRMVLGFVFGSIAGMVVGLLMASSTIARRVLNPTIELLRPMPVPALIPPLILFLGSANEMKITVVAFTVFFPVLINTIQGALAIEPTYRGVAATFGTSWFDAARKVLLPATMPFIFAGLRISLSLALIVAVVGEMVAGGSGAGIGLYIVQMEYAGRAAEMYVAIFMLGLCGYVINRSFLLVENFILHWHRRTE